MCVFCPLQVLNLELCQVSYESAEPVNVFGYIGPDTSDQAAVIAPTLSDMNKTIISHAATSPSLQGQSLCYNMSHCYNVSHCVTM